MSGSKIATIPALGGYGPIRTGQKFDSKLTVTQRGRDLISGLLTFGLINDGTYSEHISRRHSFSLRAGHKAAYICAESTMHRFMEDLTGPKEWFKANVSAIVKEYAPHHPIQKEDIIVVVGTLCAPEYALFAILIRMVKFTSTSSRIVRTVDNARRYLLGWLSFISQLARNILSKRGISYESNPSTGPFVCFLASLRLRD